MSDDVGLDRAARADQHLGRDNPPPLGANGERTGANGFRRSMLVIACLLTLACFVNVTTTLDDVEDRGASMPLWRPLTTEASSNVVLLLLAPFIYLAVRRARRLSPLRRIALLSAGSIPFSLAHVALMTGARMAIFAAAGQTYATSRGIIIYEFRKDVLTYVLLAGTFWFLTKTETVAVQPEAANQIDTFDIQEGAALTRIPIADILAARAADNYVEFMLMDGRRPLMRASLTNVEARLSSVGLVRTHRSWLVNTRHVRSITPAGSGDFRLDLGQNVIVPLSRRYPDVLASLKGGPFVSR